MKNEIITGILPNMKPMRDIKQISEGDRLFYELGRKKTLTKQILKKTG